MQVNYMRVVPGSDRYLLYVDKEIAEQIVEHVFDIFSKMVDNSASLTYKACVTLEQELLNKQIMIKSDTVSAFDRLKKKADKRSVEVDGTIDDDELYTVLHNGDDLELVNITTSSPILSLTKND